MFRTARTATKAHVGAHAFRLPAMLAALLSLLPALAAADGRYGLAIDSGSRYGTQAATVETRGDMVRWNGQGQLAQQFGYLLIRNDRVYQVMTTPWPMALDLAAAVRAFGAEGLAVGGFAPLFDELLSIEETPARETVAGLIGEVWTARARIAGEVRRIELVLHPGDAARDLRDALQRTLVLQSQALQQPLPAGYLELYNALAEQGRGLLRYGSALLVTSVESGMPVASRFDLP